VGSGVIQTGVDATIFNMQTSLCLYCLIDDHSVLFYYLFMINLSILFSLLASLF